MRAVGRAPTPLDLEHLSLDSFRDRPVAVLGLARSGVALCRFLADRGAVVTAYDAQPTDALAARLAEIGDRPVRALLGPDVDPRTVLAGQALICTSPSISSRYPTTEPRLRSALARLESEGKVPVVSEVDLFLRLCPAPTVGVTGTKGKTTTSSLAAAVLRSGSAPVLLGGNIGTPLVERLPELTPEHRVVLELSELQLPTLSRGTGVAVYTHVTSDHLDRHGSLQAYRAVKRRLAELAPEEGRVVLNAEDPVSSDFAHAARADSVFYRRSSPVPGGVGIVDGWVVADGLRRLEAVGGGFATAGPNGGVLPVADVMLPGAHSLSNVLAAVAVGLLHGIEPGGIRRAVGEFTGVEHRLETVGWAGRVVFVNDSMGTQPDAVIAALRSFEPPTVLIAGGRSKEVDLGDLAREVAARTAAVVLIGETAEEMAELFLRAGAKHTERATDMDDAVRRADRLAREALTDANEPATVLLSPAAASFDMYADYAARGDAFRQVVQRLLEEGNRG